MGLSQLVVSRQQQPQKAYINQNDYDNTDGILLACAMVDPAVGFKLGASITLPGAGSAITITAANIVSSLKALAIAGSAYWLGSEVVKGMKDKPVNGTESVTMGYGADPRNTRRVVEHIKYEFTKAYGNEDFLNQFLDNKPFDFFNFTNNSVHEALASEDITYPADDINPGTFGGETGKGIIGGFGLRYVTDGYKRAETGIVRASLTGKDVVLAIAAPTAGGDAMTAGTCALAGTKKYTKALADDSTLTFALVTANDCVDWGVYLADGTPIPSTYGTFNSLTKVLTLPSTMLAGVFTYYVTVVNKTGVTGQLIVELTVA